MWSAILKAVAEVATAFFQILLNRRDQAKKENAIETDPASDNLDKRARLLDRVHERQQGQHDESSGGLPGASVRDVDAGLDR